MDRSARWREIMARPEEETPLDEAAFLIGAMADATVDVSEQLARLDDLAAQLGPADTDELCRFVFQHLGVRADRVTYDDPRNSYLDQVISRRLGIPISLCVLLMEIGRRCGVRLEGVGMPGHFLLRDPGRPEILIDAFSGGQRLDHAACAELLRTVAGADAQLVPAYLARVGTRSIVARMLANLDHSFRRRDDKESIGWVTRLRAAIPGQSLADRVALADTFAGLGHLEEAATLLEELAQRPGTPVDAAGTLRARARGFSPLTTDTALPAPAGQDGQANDASRVISGTPARARLTGHPAFAVAACFRKSASSIPGTVPTVTRAILVMVGAPSTGRSVTVASVCTDSGGVPAWARMLDSAMEKHAACAAAINCSGFDPGPSSKRDLNV
jgi:regulator of sirC expression with transglutaminase-like and TPR domain